MAKPSIAAAREAVELLGSYPPGAVILGFFSMPSGTHVAVVHDSAQVWEQPPLRVATRVALAPLLSLIHI